MSRSNQSQISNIKNIKEVIFVEEGGLPHPSKKPFFRKFILPKVSLSENAVSLMEDQRIIPFKDCFCIMDLPIKSLQVFYDAGKKVKYFSSDQACLQSEGKKYLDHKKLNKLIVFLEKEEI